MSAGDDDVATAGDEPRLPARRWVFAITVAFLGAAAVLRSVLAFEGDQRILVLALLAVWFALVLAEPFAARAWSTSFFAYLVAQGVVVFVLLTQSDSSDFFAVLLAVPVMQTAGRRQPRAVWVLIAVYAGLTGAGLIEEYGGPTTVSLVAVYAAANVFFAAYALAAGRAVEARARNESLAADLRQANRRLTESASRAQRLGAARERQRLARDLHDSVTQTLFSMTLTARSALLLLQREPGEVPAQLDQIDHLARSALREMTALGAEPPASASEGGRLAGALGRHCTERKLRDGLAVDLEVDGDAPLPAKEESALLRIAQEGLNNVVKHAGVQAATVRLRLRPPCRLEVEDDGRGFDPAVAVGSGLGLTGMEERAAEIGWSLVVTSRPGGGTRVVAEQTGEPGEADGEGGNDGD